MTIQDYPSIDIMVTFTGLSSIVNPFSLLGAFYNEIEDRVKSGPQFSSKYKVKYPGSQQLALVKNDVYRSPNV